MIAGLVLISGVFLPIWLAAAAIVTLAVSIALSGVTHHFNASPAALASLIAVALSIPVVAWSCTLALARTIAPGTNLERLTSVAPIVAVGALLQSNAWLDLLAQSLVNQGGVTLRLLSWGSFGSLVIGCIATVVIAFAIIPLLIELPMRWFAEHSQISLVLPWQSIRLVVLVALISISFHLVVETFIAMINPVQIISELTQ